jgi:hypothetical protein
MEKSGQSLEKTRINKKRDQKEKERSTPLSERETASPTCRKRQKRNNRNRPGAVATVSETPLEEIGSSSLVKYGHSFF